MQCYPLQQEAVLAHLAPESAHLTGREEVGVAEVAEDLQQQLAGQREDGQGHRSMVTVATYICKYVTYFSLCQWFYFRCI